MDRQKQKISISDKMSKLIYYTASGYSAVEIQYLTDYFAEHIKEGYRLYIGFDSTLKPFILCLEGELPKELQALMDYTYSQEDDPMPETAHISGFCRPLNSEIMGFARDSYSMMWDESEQLPISSDDLPGRKPFLRFLYCFFLPAACICFGIKNGLRPAESDWNNVLNGFLLLTGSLRIRRSLERVLKFT